MSYVPRDRRGLGYCPCEGISRNSRSLGKNSKAPASLRGRDNGRAAQKGGPSHFSGLAETRVAQGEECVPEAQAFSSARARLRITSRLPDAAPLSEAELGVGRPVKRAGKSVRKPPKAFRLGTRAARIGVFAPESRRYFASILARPRHFRPSRPSVREPPPAGRFVREPAIR